MKILVTGAFGNIGQKVIDLLIERSHPVVCFDLDNESNRKASAKFGSRVDTLWGDITNP